MPGELPFFITGKIAEILPQEIAIVKVPNGNLYHLIPSTPGIDYYKLKVGMLISCEVTRELGRVLSAAIVDDEIKD